MTMNKSQFIWAAILLVMILGSCNVPDKKIDQQQPIFNLVGTWESTGNTIFYESWALKPDSGLVGYAYSISQAGDTMFSEKIQIVQIHDSLFYQAKVYRQNQGRIIRFAMVEQSSNQWVFENPSHDYPNRIIYRIENDSILHTRVENMAGKKSIAFRFRKVKS